MDLASATTVAAALAPSWTMLQSMAAGAVVGLSLGLTGGGGAIFAVPLLVYWIGVEPQAAVRVSLVTGAVERWRHGQVEVRTGLLFATAGMLTAPAGGWLGSRLPPQGLLASFAVLMLLIAIRMWRKARDTSERMPPAVFSSGVGPTCSRDECGRLRMTTRCFVLLGLVGLFVGVLSGLFGVGGGFLIVPALLAFATMDVPRAVGTSLFVMTLVGLSAVASQVAAGGSIPLAVTAAFVAGSIPALFAGSWIGRRLTGPVLARGFAVAIVLVAIFMIVKTLFSG
ncbi:MAG: sulfite exporter TauE/SafE family protein [Planctomycetaceae bacterium]